MSTQRRRPTAKKQAPEQPAPQDEVTPMAEEAAYQTREEIGVRSEEKADEASAPLITLSPDFDADKVAEQVAASLEKAGHQVIIHNGPHFTYVDPSEEPAPELVEAPPHVRELARKVRRYINHQRVQFDAAKNVPVFFGYNGLSHTINGHPTKHIATRDELHEMSDQQIYDAVMREASNQGRQQYPIGGR